MLISFESHHLSADALIEIFRVVLKDFESFDGQSLTRRDYLLYEVAIDKLKSELLTAAEQSAPRS